MARFSIIIFLFLLGCRPSPFQVTTIKSRGPARIELSQLSRSAWTDDKKALLKKLYKDLKQPQFALIDGYYHLPKAHPFGSVTVIKGANYFGQIEIIQQQSTNNEYALEPIKGDDALRFNQGINALLDLGVRLVHLSMADALQIAQAEEKALKESTPLLFQKLLPPATDYLISVDRTSSEKGPLLIGRVISRDGRLLAFKVVSETSGTLNFTDLLLELFENTLARVER